MSAMIKNDIHEYLHQQECKGFLRFITCGSVDDGKSTLIGRLLYDSKSIFEDQLAELERDSTTMGSAGGQIDLALLVDGLAAEREQGITIDVAYQFFSTDKRKFIVADTPGHEQYTRNMATGASTAQLAVILIDARKGILTQTRRHSYIVSMLGIKHVVVAINKMDLVGFSQSCFEKLVHDYEVMAGPLGFEGITAIPISALNGDNVLNRSAELPWYDGLTLMAHLETVKIDSIKGEQPFRFPVQWVNRPNLDFRGFSGTIASGNVRVGDKVVALPSGLTSQVKSIVTSRGDLDQAVTEQAVTLCLEDEIDISRGDIIVAANARAEITDQFEAAILWMHSNPLLPGRSYLIKTENKTLTGVVTKLKHRVNVNDFNHEPVDSLNLNEVGLCNVSLSGEIVFEPYHSNRNMGSFIIIDKMTNHTLGCGMINHGLRRATNIHWQAMDINKVARAQLLQQKPCILWFTGFSGSGKSSIANLVEKKLFSKGKYSYLLDGDNVRHGLNRDLGFTNADRVENIRRISETAKLMLDAGLIVITSFISPFLAERQLARDLVEDNEFIEVFVDTPIAVCEQRDPKGLYKKVRNGDVKNFTGFDSPYEIPNSPEIHIDTLKQTAHQAADIIVEYLLNRIKNT